MKLYTWAIFLFITGRSLATDVNLPAQLTPRESSFMLAVSHAIITADEKMLAEFTYTPRHCDLESRLRAYRAILAGGAQKISFERVDLAEATETKIEGSGVTLRTPIPVHWVIRIHHTPNSRATLRIGFDDQEFWLVMPRAFNPPKA